jgi:hypothetical protein
MKKLVAVLGVLVVVSAGSLTPARGLDQGLMGTMGPKETAKTKTHIKKDFPPLAAVYPGRTSPQQAFVFYNSYGCINYSYCNRHEFDVSVPDGYLESLKGSEFVSYGVKVTLTWPDPKGNDVDLFVGWQEESAASGAPGGPCSTPADTECDTLSPEVYAVVEPKSDDDETTPEDESKLPAKIFMSVVNDTGVNTGYTIDIQWFLIPFGSFPDFKPPKAGAASRARTITASRTPKPFEDPATKDQETVTKILVPGPDGKLVEQELNFLEAGNRFKAAKTGTSPWVWIVSAVASVAAVVAFFYLIWQRRRREALG